MAIWAVCTLARANGSWHFILYSGRCHPAAIGREEGAAFLTHLAVNRKVAASTHNQAVNALLFLYTQVLGRELGWLYGVQRAKKPSRLPVVLSRQEVQKVLSRMRGRYRLMAGLLYGSGLRLSECVSLRIQDVGFDDSQITVRRGKGGGAVQSPIDRLAAGCVDMGSGVLVPDGADVRTGTSGSIEAPMQSPPSARTSPPA